MANTFDAEIDAQISAMIGFGMAAQNFVVHRSTTLRRISGELG